MRDKRTAERFDPMETGRSARSRLLVRAVAIGVLAAGAWGAWQGFFREREDERIVHSIELLTATPPPMKDEEPPPEVEEAEEVDLEPGPEDLPADDQPQPIDDRLGVDADGGTGGDSFGLVAKRGGRDLTTITGGGGGGGMMSGMLLGFAQALRADIESQLGARDELRRRRYVAVVKLWISPDGRLERYELAQAPAARELQTAVTDALDSLDRVTPPPAGIPQPVWVRITSRTQG